MTTWVQITDYSATRIPSWSITGHHPWSTGSPVGDGVFYPTPSICAVYSTANRAEWSLVYLKLISPWCNGTILVKRQFQNINKCTEKGPYACLSSSVSRGICKYTSRKPNLIKWCPPKTLEYTSSMFRIKYFSICTMGFTVCLKLPETQNLPHFFKALIRIGGQFWKSDRFYNRSRCHVVYLILITKMSQLFRKVTT